MTGGPRSDHDRRDDVEEWPEERIQAQLEERRRAEAVAGTEPEPRARTDGGEDDYLERVAEQLSEAIESDAEPQPASKRDDLPNLNVGDHVQDRLDDEQNATMVVVERTPHTAISHTISHRRQMADGTPDRFYADRVIKVVLPDEEDTELDTDDVTAYPRGRLRRTAAVRGTDGEEGGEPDA